MDYMLSNDLLTHQQNIHVDRTVGTVVTCTSNTRQV